MSRAHYDHQVRMANEFVIPLLKHEIGLNTNTNVLEVGCAESGVLRVLTDLDIPNQGIELLEGRIKLAKEINPDLEIHQGDITDEQLIEKFETKFDLIIIRDVIEHIRDQEKAFEVMHKLLKDKGFMYITFPPLYSPYAGHQQGCKGVLKGFLWLHLLPDSVIRLLGKITGTHGPKIEEIIYNSHVGLSISRFTKIYKRTGFSPKKKDLFFLRPVFKVRWNWPVIQMPAIPVVKEIFSTGCEYLLQKT